MIIVTGSLAFDYILNFPGEFSQQILPEKIHKINLSFTTDKLKREFGGTAGNQAYNLALLGHQTAVLATCGYDFADYKKHLDKAGVSTKYIKKIPSKLSSSGFVLTDKKDNQIWGFAKSAMTNAKRLTLEKIPPPIDFVVISPNEPKAIENFINQSISLNLPYLFDPAFYITVLPEKVLKKGVLNAKILIGNDYEIAMIKKIINPKFKKDQIVITTLGAKGSIIKKGKKEIYIKPARPKNTSDPTGAGDAYRAGFLSGFLNKYDLKTCGQMGSVCAVYTVEKYGTQTHKFTKSQFIKRYQKNYGQKIDL